MKNFNGKILFLDRSDINTDEIIPAKYLTELTKAALKPYCLEDLSLEGFDPKKDIEGKAVIVTRANFGCGSSREHAPWVLECNNINLVIAVNFARIFRQNAVEFLFGFENLIGLDGNVTRLTLRTAQRLVNHNFTVGQGVTFALCPAG